MQRLMDKHSPKMPSIARLSIVNAGPAIGYLADWIEQGKIKQEEWEFLVWLQDDEEVLDKE